ncbi:MAG TPA: hypothetical protein DCG12_24500 [Planctomycetaceae bacterium]|nr:hypothetical protein [Planctomycetaceae bacterium]|tara:strand:+ start:95 stop:532 length:438 start_codon:yes stop_codon:yes gene_type:complete
MSDQSQSALNSALIDMSRSFLQYVAEGWPWVDSERQAVGDQVLALAESQRSDVAAIVELLNEREHFIDFGSFPTEYTDLQFLALDAMFSWLENSQQVVIASTAAAEQTVKAAEDAEAAELMEVIHSRQKELADKLKEVRSQAPVQ